MSDKRDLQEHETIGGGFDLSGLVSGLVEKLPSIDTSAAWLGKLDAVMVPFWGVVVAWLTYIVGTGFYNYGPTSVPELTYQTNLFASLSSVAFVIVAVAFFESLRRNELSDTLKVVVAIAVNYLAMRFNGTWLLMALAYGFGFSLSHSASRHGKLDWTPLVAYNAAFIGLTTSFFNFAGTAVIFPVLVGMVVQAIEIFRARDYQAVRLAVPGLVVAGAGVVLSVNPVGWILVGAALSFIVVPTLVKLYHSKTGKHGVWLKTSAQPCNGWDNGFKNLRVNFESAMLTLVASCVFAIAVLMLN